MKCILVAITAVSVFRNYGKLLRMKDSVIKLWYRNVTSSNVIVMSCVLVDPKVVLIGYRTATSSKPQMCVAATTTNYYPNKPRGTFHIVF